MHKVAGKVPMVLLPWLDLGCIKAWEVAGKMAGWKILPNPSLLLIPEPVTQVLLSLRVADPGSHMDIVAMSRGVHWGWERVCWISGLLVLLHSLGFLEGLSGDSCVSCSCVPRDTALCEKMKESCYPAVGGADVLWPLCQDVGVFLAFPGAITGK